MKAPVTKMAQGHVQCPICTHTVPATVEYTVKRATVVRGQKCQRCHSSLDAAALFYRREAA
jgi:transposase-like protein